MIRLCFMVWVPTLVLAVAAKSALANAEPAKATEPALISVRKGASLIEALAAVHSATNAAVVADASASERRLEVAIDGEPAESSLVKISRAFHLHSIRREKHIALVRQLWDAREPLDLETSEISAVVQDLYRLVSPFSPHYRDMESTLDRNAFYRSLTNEQIEAMHVGGGHPRDAIPTADRPAACRLGEALRRASVRPT